MILPVHADNPQPRQINRIVETLRGGGVIAYPTDTIYGIGCDITNRKAIQQIYRIKARDPKKPFAFICPDLAAITRFAQVSNFAFRILKQRLPGPYTFILETTRQTPEILTTKQKTVGIRIPDNRIALAIVAELGEPLVTTSVNLSGSNPLSDPYEIEDEFGSQLDLVVDGGILMGDPSTVISLVGDRIVVLRQGCGETSWITEG